MWSTATLSACLAALATGASSSDALATGSSSSDEPEPDLRRVNSQLITRKDLSTKLMSVSYQLSKEQEKTRRLMKELQGKDEQLETAREELEAKDQELKRVWRNWTVDWNRAFSLSQQLYEQQEKTEQLAAQLEENQAELVEKRQELQESRQLFVTGIPLKNHRGTRRRRRGGAPGIHPVPANRRANP